MVMSLKNGEGLFVYLFPKEEEEDPEAWNYPCSVDMLHDIFVKEGIYDKQKMIAEKDIRELYQLLHLGIYQNQILPKWNDGRLCLIGDAAQSSKISKFDKCVENCVIKLCNRF